MRYLIFVALFLSLNTSTFSFADSCEQIFAEFQKKPEIEWINDQVAIIFYPQEWHAEILVNGNMYNRSIFANNRSYSFESVKRAALKGYSSGFYAFYIRVNSDELKDIEAYLNTNDKKSISCMYGACAPININTEMTIPTPIALLPLTTAAYLSFRHFLGDSSARVQKIELISRNNPINHIYISAILEGTAIGSTAIILTRVAFIIIATADDVFEFLVPILSSDSLK